MYQSIVQTVRVSMWCGMASSAMTHSATVVTQKWRVPGLQSGNTPKKHLKNKGSCVCWKVAKPQLTQEPVVYLSPADKSHRLTRRLSQEQKVLYERALRAS